MYPVSAMAKLFLNDVIISSLLLYCTVLNQQAPLQNCGNDPELVDSILFKCFLMFLNTG